MSFIKNKIVGFLIERPGSQQDLAGWQQTLQTSGQTLVADFAAKADSENNRRVLSHIIGIERWGQRRLQVALGAAPMADEYDSYRPARECTWAEMQQDFAETRQETAVLLTKITDPTIKIRHNDLGDLTVLGWLQYLNMHANMEAKKLR